MLVPFKKFIQSQNQEVSESFLGKSLSVIQTRQHAANKTKLESLLSKIQNDAKKGQVEQDENERFKLLFGLFIDLAAALKVASEMSKNTINVSALGVLDAENIYKGLSGITNAQKLK